MLSNELKTHIQGAYSRFLEAKGLKPRYGQRLMIAEVAKVLGGIEMDVEGRRVGKECCSRCRSRWSPDH